MPNKRKSQNQRQKKASKKAPEDNKQKAPPLGSSSDNPQHENQPSEPAAVAAKPHPTASGTVAPSWESVFRDARFWDARWATKDLQDRLTREGFDPTSARSVACWQSTYTLMFNGTDYQQKVFRMATLWSQSETTHTLHHWFCNVNNIEFARQSHEGPPPLSEGLQTTLQDAIINKLGVVFPKTDNKKLHQVKVCNGHGGSSSPHVFYIGNPKFRHQARDGISPPQLYMEKADGDLVLLYCSASGSGKTAELAASAYSRDAAFSIQLDVEQDIPTAAWGDKRQGEARISLKTTIDKLVDQDKSIRALFAQIADMIKHHSTKEDMVRIVVAIDEAGSQPNLVNEIIHHHKDLGQDLAAFIMTGCNNPDESGNCDDEKEWKDTQKESLQVVFSIAGTGLHGDMKGSLPDNFNQLQPIAQRKVEDVYNVLCEEHPGKSNTFPPFEQLPEYPLLNDIVHHNSRMTSALVFHLATNNFSYGDPRHQVKAVTAVFEDFCTSNGMLSVWEKPHFRLQVVASAYAALLFQKKIKVSPGDPPHVIREKALDNAIHFQHFGEGHVAIRNLIGEYGLLTTRSCTDLSRQANGENKDIEVSPFLMDPAMQRLCGWMIAGGEVMAHPDEALGTTPFAYEALAVQFLSSVIAAATTVEPEDRKDLKSMLEHGAAMYASEVRGDGGTPTPLFVDDDVAKSWEGLAGWYPVAFPSEFAMKGMYLQQLPMDLSLGRPQPQRSPEQEKKNRTYWHGLEGRVVERDNPGPFTDTNKLQTYTPLQYSSEDTLTIDKDYLQGLWDLRNAIIEGPTLEEGTQAFYPPIASVAEGNSNLADGYVSVVVARKKEDGNKVVWENLKLVTICIQAKDYTTGAPIPNETIRHNKNKVLHKLLHIPFGEDRVYCVASQPKSLVNRTMSQDDVAEAESKRDEDVGKRAVADALRRERCTVIENVYVNEMNKLIFDRVQKRDREQLIRKFERNATTAIYNGLRGVANHAENKAITQAEANKTHLASYIAIPIGESAASKALADAGIHRGKHGKTERFGVQLKYSPPGTGF